MKFLCSIERITIIRWVTIAYIGALVLPVLFLRYGNIIAVAQSALLIALPIATAGLALSHAKVPASYVSFSIHDKVLLRFIAKSLLLAQVVNLCLSLLYVSVIGEIVNEPLSSHTALVLVFSSVVLTLACFALRLWTTSLVSWIVIIFLWWQVFRLALVILQTHLFCLLSFPRLGFQKVPPLAIYFLPGFCWLR